MKKFIVILALLSVTTIYAQQPIERSIGEFSTLKVFDLIEVKLIQSKDNKVVINGKNKSDVEIVNKDGLLKIRMKLEELFDGNNTSVTLYYSNLDIIDVNEGARVYTEDIIDQFEIDLRAQEGASIKANINVKYATIRAVTGGKIEATGKADQQDITIYTGGIYQGEACVSVNSDVAIRAAGEAHVYTTNNLDIKIRAGGDVFVYSDPKTIDESRVLGGRIKRM
ncbi:MAG: DUF2807 domain-containing protein [Bacteroidia bacterium]|nr:DUF2807 domain-containing protein [Winogradskyella sp.]MBT8375254.1 DUF2807 domain-containing protein [Bacteroidia bacterium]